MKVAKQICFAAALLACGIPLNVAMAQAEPGIYAGFLFGNSAGRGSPNDFNQLAQDVYAGVNTSADVRNRPSFDDKDTGFGFAVGYRLTRWLALEGGYVDLGEQSYGETSSGQRFFFDENNMLMSTPANFTQKLDSSIAGFVFSALGILPISFRWEAYARAGLMIGNDEIDISITDDTNGGNARFDTSEGTTDVMLGIGISYSLVEIYTLRAEFTRILDAGDGLSGESDIDLLSIGATVRF